MEERNLTQKEQEILCLASKGLARKQIARQLNITYGTLDTHFKHIFLKLKTRGILETTVYAIANNLV